eukprot:gene20043-27062_t
MSQTPISCSFHSLFPTATGDDGSLLEKTLIDASQAKAGIDSLSAFDLSQLDVGFRGFEGADFPGPLDDAPLVWTTEPGSLQLLPDGSAPGAAVETPEDGGADIA